MCLAFVKCCTRSDHGWSEVYLRFAIPHSQLLLDAPRHTRAVPLDRGCQRSLNARPQEAPLVVALLVSKRWAAVLVLSPAARESRAAIGSTANDAAMVRYLTSRKGDADLALLQIRQFDFEDQVGT